MPALRPSRGPVQLPKMQTSQAKSPEGIVSYANNLVRAIEQQLNALFQLNNQTLVIEPSATYTTSIAGNTVDTSKVRDFALTAIQMVRQNNGLN